MVVLFCFSVEAVTLLAVSGFITILIVTILCYVRWHSRFLKSDSSEFSHTAKNLETVTAQQNEHQGTLPPQATLKRYACLSESENLGLSLAPNTNFRMSVRKTILKLVS